MKQRNRIQRIVACFLAMNLLFEVISPTVAMALTNGPSQPEMQSFEPVGTTEMVDVFTGDFNYNLPLLNVPGPNGGYPLNLAYHSGIGMEEEASWVGLGWNINAGVITRDMRGLPDDFKGDVVTKEMNMNPNRTIGVGIGLPPKHLELWGFQVNTNMNLRMSWNNYQGLGFNGSLSLTASAEGNGATEMDKANRMGYGVGLTLDYNSFSGESTLRPSFSLSYRSQQDKDAFGADAGVGATLSNLHGIKDINYNAGYKDTKRNLDVNGNFASSSFVPHSEFPQSGFMLNTWFNLGGDAAGVYVNLNFNGDYSESGLKKNKINYHAYGYMHSEERRIEENKDVEEDALMDFNREKNAQLARDIPSLPVPIYTHDVYTVKGQGVGGMFRPFRSDVGVLHDPVVKSSMTGVNIGGELGLGYPLHIGVNVGLGLTRNYTGPWRKFDTWSDLASNQFTKNNISPIDQLYLTMDPLYEPFYFRSPSDLTANRDDENDRVSSGSKYSISMLLDPPDISSFADLDPDNLLQPFVEVRANNNGVVNKKRFNNRRSRSDYMGYRTIKQLQEYPGYVDGWIGRNVYTMNNYPRNSAAQGYSFPNGITHHLGEISVINPDGNRYIYALPAYNYTNKEVSFSIERGGSHATHYNDKIIDYDPGDASTGNSQQKDHFYSASYIPTYAHSYLLTAIVSPDYVDLTGNGPSEDDFGYYTKFNYSRSNPNPGSHYHWRAPYEGANFLKGYLSSDTDDKAGYTYGEKEVWYLNSVETKTHIAEFKLSARADGYGAALEHQNVGTASYNGLEQLYKVDQIDLYSKSDAGYASGNPTPIKTVHFEYTYDLCPGTPNNNGTGNKGKLTLKKVWFSFLNNTKGSLSPYVFDYHETNAAENPAYDMLQMDRWGNYRPDDPTNGEDNTVNPYTKQYQDLNDDNVIDSQDDDLRNAMASAWCLKRIVLPSGGEIKVDYESDDYAYVQDKRAMQMMKIVGTASSVNNGVSLSTEVSDGNKFLFFELEDGPSTASSISSGQYADGISQVFFKAYMNLKKDGGGGSGTMKSDYVQGYADIEPGKSGEVMAYLPNGGAYKRCGWIQMKSVSVKDNGGGPSTHAFSKATWQYLSLERPELLYPGSSVGNGGGSAMLKQAGQMLYDVFNSIAQLFTGFYKFCYISNYGKNIDLVKPSFVRLNSPDKIKYGGGLRVKRLVMTDQWARTGTNGEALSQYGQEYSYRLTDGTSSGVAAYEPMVGGEENPHRMPIRYSTPYFLVKNKNLYIEEPLCESYYPAPVVGYSRVVTKNIEQRDANNNPVTKTAEGISVYEFYTAKDFPMIVTNSGLDHEKFTPKIPIPTIGSVYFENHGFSQRLSVETNDMHGKPKSYATYPAAVDINNPNVLPLTKTEHLYKTDAPYASGNSNHLNNHVPVLFNDGVSKDADMGYSTEFFTDMHEASGVTMKQGFQNNIEYCYPWAPVYTGMAAVDYSESMFKYVVGMEVISRNGILMETREYKDGSSVTNKNLMFDANSGQPLFTSTTNNFDANVYTYKYAATWQYEGMGNAFKNGGAVFNFMILNTPGYHLSFNYTNRSAYDVFYPGDEILVNNATPTFNVLPAGKPNVFWVKSIINNHEVELIDEQGNPPTVSYVGNGLLLSGTIVRSGRRNQQSAINGQVVSLSNTAQGSDYSFINNWNFLAANYNATNTTPSNPNEMLVQMFDCNYGTLTQTMTLIPTSTVTPYDHINAKADRCKIEISAPVGVTLPNDWYTYTLEKQSPTSIKLSKNGTSYLCTWGYFCSLCDQVLLASASTYTDTWNYDYGDVGDPKVQYQGSGTPIPLTATVAANNPYRMGTKGIWRPYQNYVVLTQRDQSGPADGTGTDISRDGQYISYKMFDWQNPTGSAGWSLTSTTTLYSPYGFEIEDTDALGIYNSALYGYKNSLQTAITKNAAYYETAFDGFEEGTSYSKKGHMNLTASTGSIAMGLGDGHTGNQCLAMSIGQNLVFNTANSVTNYCFRPVNVSASAPKRYTVSAWFKTDAGIKPQINISGQATNAVTIADGVRIEGWQKVETSFDATGTNIVISFGVPNAATRFSIDDIRIQPFKSIMKTYVYDPQTLWLLAELDEQNYATFYNYDEEGVLVQVKKETVRGIQTLQTTRNNMKRL